MTHLQQNKHPDYLKLQEVEPETKMVQEDQCLQVSGVYFKFYYQKPHICFCKSKSKKERRRCKDLFCKNFLIKTKKISRSLVAKKKCIFM